MPKGQAGIRVLFSPAFFKINFLHFCISWCNSFPFFYLLGTICSEPEVDSGITILEGLAASGLRSVRYALEIPGVKNITANDISEDAYRMMKLNIQHNKVQHIVSPSKEDAGLVFFLFSLRWK